ncbi:hypothetical protein M3Y97_00194400 [Aphelenchoides bicaudatus]|nr:hypothetical protein M3Y97_00194400 [Aphelenchoides bicaudatus]
MWSSFSFNMYYLVALAILAVVSLAEENTEKRMAFAPFGLDEFSQYDNFYGPADNDREKRDEARPGLLRFGKRDSEIPGLLRFGKRSQPFVRYGRSLAGVEKKEMPGVLRFGKRSTDGMPGVLRFGKRSDIPGVLRFGKRSDIPGVLRFGKRASDFVVGDKRYDSEIPGLLRFGRK